MFRYLLLVSLSLLSFSSHLFAADRNVSYEQSSDIVDTFKQTHSTLFLSNKNSDSKKLVWVDNVEEEEEDDETDSHSSKIISHKDGSKFQDVLCCLEASYQCTRYLPQVDYEAASPLKIYSNIEVFRL